MTTRTLGWHEIHVLVHEVDVIGSCVRNIGYQLHIVLFQALTIAQRLSVRPTQHTYLLLKAAQPAHDLCYENLSIWALCLGL